MRLFLLLALMLLAGAASAEEDCFGAPLKPISVSENITNELIGWIALHTMYDVSLLFNEPPKITFCEIGDMIDYEASTIRVEPFLSAAFNLPEREIYLVMPWSQDDPYDRSVLLHELIHDVQLSNRDWPCVGAPEMEAYRLQAKYLAENGVKPDFDWAGIYALSRCPKD